MAAQQQQLDALREWLTATEDRISRMAQTGPDMSDLQHQLNNHCELQRDLQAQQSTVDTLCNLVVVVDDNVSDSSKDFTTNFWFIQWALWAVLGIQTINFKVLIMALAFCQATKISLRYYYDKK